MSYDLVIIGAGPAGLTAGIYAAARKLNAVILEAGDGGGQPGNVYPEKPMANYPGLPVNETRDLMARFSEHALKAGCDIRRRERALDIADKGDVLLVHSEKAEYETKAVILATGGGLYKPKRLGAVGEEEFEGRGVYYRLPETHLLEGKRVLFVGGGNSALEMALLCATMPDTYTCLVHRRDTFRADACNVDRLGPEGVKTYLCSEVAEIKGKDKVESVILKVGDPPELEEMPIDMVVIHIGFTTEPEDIKRWGIEPQDGLIKVGTDMRTSRRGVFACGDIVTYPGKYKQIVVACGEAATAANSAYKYIAKPYWA
jgi:thioredoxin reductase